VFVSTVRSRHHVSQLMDSVSEFGFLSDARLVNTALTRAKSWLAVIGDPVALCSVGSCGPVWRGYLKHCQKVGGVHPSELSIDAVFQHSHSLMDLLSVSSSVTAEVNEFTQHARKVTEFTQHDIIAETPAPLLVDHQSTQSTKDSAPQAANIEQTEAHDRLNVSTGKCETPDSDEENNSVRLKAATHTRTSCGLKAMSHNTSADVMNLSEWSFDYQLEPDEIIKQFAKVGFVCHLHLF